MSFFNRFNPREKLILFLLMIVLSGLSMHAFLIEPYFQQKEALAEELIQAKEDLNWIADAVQNLPLANSSQPQKTYTGSLTNRVNQLVQQMGLKEKLAQMTPVGSNEVRMRFAKIEFNRFILLVARCRDLGIEVKTFRIDAIKDPALVDGSIVLTGQT